MSAATSDRGAPRQGPPARADAPVLLEAAQVGFELEGRAILQPLQLAVQAGSMVGIIGPNGSGKSTLGRILARQTAPSCGELRVRGQPARSIPARQFARMVAYLPQQIPPAVGLTVAELVALGRYPWQGVFGAPGKADRDSVRDSIAITSVGELERRLVDTLSGGERQRAWLAMLVAQQADVLVLDEPTSALDIRHQVEVLALLRHLCKQRGLGVVVILHDVYMAGRYCDELVALRQGRLVAAGPGEQILQPAVLKSVYDIDMDVMVHQPSGNRVVCLCR